MPPFVGAAGPAKSVFRSRHEQNPVPSAAASGRGGVALAGLAVTVVLPNYIERWSFLTFHSHK